jgi:hypothetical protein
MEPEVIILRSGVDEATRDACDHSALSAAGDFEDGLSTTGGLYPTSIEGGSVHAEEEPWVSLWNSRGDDMRRGTSCFMTSSYESEEPSIARGGTCKSARGSNVRALTHMVLVTLHTHHPWHIQSRPILQEVTIEFAATLF